MSRIEKPAHRQPSRRSARLANKSRNGRLPLSELQLRAIAEYEEQAEATKASATNPELSGTRRPRNTPLAILSRKLTARKVDAHGIYQYPVLSSEETSMLERCGRDLQDSLAWNHMQRRAESLPKGSLVMRPDWYRHDRVPYRVDDITGVLRKRRLTDDMIDNAKSPEKKQEILEKLRQQHQGH